MNRRRMAVVASSLLFLVGSIGCEHGESVANRKPDVYLLLVDTLRADHLSLYGYTRPTSPNLERFAETAVVFQNVVAPAPWTLPSVGSVMTGIYPSVHGLRVRATADGMTGLRSGVSTLAEALASEGYRTVAVVTNPWLTSEHHGLARGFEEYISLEMANAPAVNDLAKKLIDHEDGRPLFLYLHYMDPHGPYDRHREFDPSSLGPVPSEFRRRLERSERAAIPTYLRMRGGGNLATFIQAYDRAIRAWDDSFGAWLTWLDAKKTDPPPVIAVISDHGEEFAERGAWSHGETLYEEQLFVPWLMRVPGELPRRVDDRVVSLTDVAPTLLGNLGLPVPKTMTGANVLSPAFPLDRPVYSETEVRTGGLYDERYVQRAVRRGHRKQIIRPTGPECYDLAEDPDERDSECAPGSAYQQSTADLEQWIQESETLSETLGEGPSMTLDPEMEERLRAIGYIQ